MSAQFPTRFKQRLSIALLISRLALGIFLLLWALEKFIVSQATEQIWSNFYRLDLSTSVITILAVLQTILAIASIADIFRPITYGVASNINAVSPISIWRQLFDPWGATAGGIANHLFLAGIPVLAGFASLYILYSWGFLSLAG